jgi:hypothetical protein
MCLVGVFHRYSCSGILLIGFGVFRYPRDMNNSSRIGAQGFSHSGTQLGNGQLVSRVAMVFVTGALALFAGSDCAMGGTPSAANSSQEIAPAKAKKEAARLVKLQPLIAEQLKLGMEAAGKKKWPEASKAVAKVLEMDPDHAGAQELKRRVFWGPLPGKVEGNLKYKEHPFDPTCVISGVANKKRGVPPVLPTQFEGRAVVRIGHKAFYDCYLLKSVTIPSGVTSIGNEAFSKCVRLTSVTIPSGVTSIGRAAFCNSLRLKSVTIPSGVTSIGDKAFMGCGRLTWVSIPSSVTRIGRSAFGGCRGLTSVTIPSSVTSIENTAFSDCKGLISVTIQPGVTRIGDWAFSGCKALALVTIPSSVTRIGDGAFSLCVRLQSVTIPSSVTRIGHSAFSRCTDLISVTIPSSVTSVGDRAFEHCSGLKSVTIPSSVTSIGDRAFEYCSGLKSVTIPSSVTLIGYGAFADCDGLKSVTIPSSVTRIGAGPFAGCGKLATLTVAAGNLSYQVDGGVLFTKGGKTLVQYPIGKPGGTYTIPSSVTSIGNRAFGGCEGLKSVTIPSSVTSIGEQAFGGCFNLMAISVAKGNPSYQADSGVLFTKGGKTLVQYPMGKARQEATRRAKLQPLIAKQLKVAGEAAGKNKWGEAAKAAAKVLKMDPDHAVAQELKRRASWGPLPEKTLGNLKYKVHPIHQACAITGVLDNKNTVAFLVLPDEIEGRPLIRIGREAFLWCKVLESVTIPSSVTSIGDEAFATCFNLVNLSVAAGNPVYEADGGVLFTKGGKTLLLYPQGKPGETYIIPSSVTSIGNEAFAWCRRLKSVTIRSSVTRIGDRAFMSCGRLTSVTIPSSVTRMGDRAFASCSRLTSVTIPSSVTRIGEQAFIACRDLTSVTISEGVTSIGSDAFVRCNGLTSVTIPSSVTRIGVGPFARCGKLATLTVAAGNLSYQVDGGVLFTKGGKMLVQYPAGKAGEIYTIPSSVTSIGEQAFGGCKGLTSVTIPSSVTSIGSWAFYGCKGLKSVTLPKGVKIGTDSFKGCPWQPSE